MLKGLVRRRAAEIKLFQTPDAAQQPGPSAHATIASDGYSYPGLDPLTGYPIAAGWGTSPSPAAQPSSATTMSRTGSHRRGSRCTGLSRNAPQRDSDWRGARSRRPPSQIPTRRLRGGRTARPRTGRVPPQAGTCRTSTSPSVTVTWPSPPAGAIPSPPQVATLIAYFTGDIYKLSVQDTNPSQERIAGSTPSNDVTQCGLASAVPGEQCAAYEGLRGPDNTAGARAPTSLTSSPAATR